MLVAWGSGGGPLQKTFRRGKTEVRQMPGQRNHAVGRPPRSRLRVPSLHHFNIIVEKSLPSNISCLRGLIRSAASCALAVKATIPRRMILTSWDPVADRSPAFLCRERHRYSVSTIAQTMRRLSTAFTSLQVYIAGKMADSALSIGTMFKDIGSLNHQLRHSSLHREKLL